MWPNLVTVQCTIQWPSPGLHITKGGNRNSKGGNQNSKNLIWAIRMPNKGLCTKISPLIVSVTIWPRGPNSYFSKISDKCTAEPIEALCDGILHWSVQSGFVVYYVNSHNLRLFKKSLVLVPKNVIRSAEIIVQEINKILQFPFFPLRRKANNYLKVDNWFSGV